MVKSQNILGGNMVFILLDFLLLCGNKQQDIMSLSQHFIMIQSDQTFARLQNKWILKNIQSNFNGSNTDGSFTMAYSNSFFSPYGIFPIPQGNKY